MWDYAMCKIIHVLFLGFCGECVICNIGCLCRLVCILGLCVWLCYVWCHMYCECVGTWCVWMVYFCCYYVDFWGVRVITEWDGIGLCVLCSFWGVVGGEIAGKFCGVL